MLLDLGEIERFLIFYMVRDAKLNAKDRKGRDFGNQNVAPDRVAPDASSGVARSAMITADGDDLLAQDLERRALLAGRTRRPPLHRKC